MYSTHMTPSTTACLPACLPVCLSTWIHTNTFFRYKTLQVGILNNIMILESRIRYAEETDLNQQQL